MKITIIQFGKDKDKYIKDGIAEYLKRLNTFCKLEIITLKESTGKKNKLEQIEEESMVLKEKLINFSDYYRVVLDIKGVQKSSEELAKALKQIRDFGGGKLLIVIGGPFGLSEQVKRMFNSRLSFGKMTFTHQMIRLLLFEQLYRVFTIIEGRKYHY